ncbi:hypothetical protein ONV78_04310 [Hahella sp. CR1]|uniref:hypothetical protein n=1 Tax=Hahella sp. CR1 TaxID=2992807 RepID=UPI002441F1DA|nr:hypothetical protein [Hahella sp. CR1]MDG9666950.1 hypothetical protein [Hahella sp. CR1]
MHYVDMSKVVETSAYLKTLSQDKDDFSELLRAAGDELAFYNWCEGILQSYIGMYTPGILGVFLFQIRPTRPEVDEWVWVITGDLPTAYITTEDAPNAACALDGYIGAMEEWVAAVEQGESVQNLIPVNAPPTPEYAQALKVRLELLDQHILADYQDDLAQTGTAES